MHLKKSPKFLKLVDTKYTYVIEINPQDYSYMSESSESSEDDESNHDDDKNFCKTTVKIDVDACMKKMEQLYEN